MSVSPSDCSPSEREPPGPRSKRRWCIVFGSLLVALLVLRLIWGAIADRRVSALLAAAEAAGDPVTLEALQAAADASARDGDNAVPTLQLAGKAVDRSIDSPSNSNFDYNPFPPFPPAWHTMMDAALASPTNVKALEMAREARGRTRFRWDVQFRSPVVKNISTGGMNDARSLANLLCDTALHEHVRGNDVEALERVRDTLHLADAPASQRTLIGHLVGLGIDALALMRLEAIAPGLRIPADPDAPLRGAVRSLVDELANDRDAGANLRAAMAAERVFVIDTVRWSASRTWVVRPMYELELARMLQAQGLLIAAATQPTRGGVDAILAQMPPLEMPPAVNMLASGVAAAAPDPPRFSRQLSGMMLTSLPRVVETDLRVRMSRQMAATSLAAQLHRADHGGRWPATLDELVPRYLPRVPLDPLSKESRPIGYMIVRGGRADGGDRPVLTSAGADGIDESRGATTLPASRAKPQYGWNYAPRGEIDDQYCDLSRWEAPQPAPPAEWPADPDPSDSNPPSTAPTTQPIAG